MAQDTGEYAHALQVWLRCQSEHALFNGYSKEMKIFKNYLNTFKMSFRYYVHSDWLKKRALQNIAPRSLSCHAICQFFVLKIRQ